MPLNAWRISDSFQVPRQELKRRPLPLATVAPRLWIFRRRVVAVRLAWLVGPEALREHDSDLQAT